MIRENRGQQGPSTVCSVLYTSGLSLQACHADSLAAWQGISGSGHTTAPAAHPGCVARPRNSRKN